MARPYSTLPEQSDLDHIVQAHIKEFYDLDLKGEDAVHDIWEYFHSPIRLVPKTIYSKTGGVVIDVHRAILKYASTARLEEIECIINEHTKA